MSLRDRLKEETRNIIIDAFTQCLAKSDINKVTYSEIAARADVGERTIYRYFPNREDLLKALYLSFAKGSDSDRPYPAPDRDLDVNLLKFFTFFDKTPAVAKAAAITPQGHEMRLSMTRDRTTTFLSVLSDATAQLSEEDKRLAAAAFQHLASLPAWLAMREIWGLDGPQAAKACAWACRALFADLKARGATPIEELDIPSNS